VDGYSELGHRVQRESSAAKNYRKPKRHHTLRGALSNATRAQMLLLTGLGMPTGCSPEYLHADSNLACKISRYLTPTSISAGTKPNNMQRRKIGTGVAYERDTFPFKNFLCCRAGVLNLGYMYPWGYICLSKGVHSRLAIEGKNIFTCCLFSNLYTYVT